MPGSQPRYSESYAKIEQLLAGERSGGELAEPRPACSIENEEASSTGWTSRGHDEPFLLIRDGSTSGWRRPWSAARRRSGLREARTAQA